MDRGARRAVGGVWSSKRVRQVAAIKALSEHVAAWVHPSVQADAFAAERHRSFLLAHFALGVAPFMALPALLAAGFAPAAAEAMGFAWLLVPILAALQLSRSGRLARAHLLSSLALTLLAAVVAVGAGGLLTPVAPLAFAMAAFEAGLSGSRRAALAGAAAAAGAATAVALAGAFGALPPAAVLGSGIEALGLGALALHAAGQAVRAARLIGAAAAEARAARVERDLVAGASNDLVTRHARDGSVLHVSGAAHRLLGAAPRDLLGRGLFERVHIADRPAYLHALAYAGTEPATLELRVRRDDRPGAHGPAFVWLELKVAADASAPDGAALGVFRDVSERRLREEEAGAAREAANLEAVQRAQFLAAMGHEIRTPLNAIIGFSEMLGDERLMRAAPERRSDYAALIRQSGEHLLEIVDHVLDISRIETGRFAVAPAPCAAGEVLAHCVGLLAPRAEAAGVRLAFEVAADLPPILADRRALTQVTLNLISNAIKFTPRGGDVAVSLSATRGLMTLSVRDSGVGVAAEHLERLGDAYFQAEGAAGGREGMGLGLSVVRGLVELHGGRLAFDSAPGRGMRVTVAMPLDGGSPAASGAGVVARPDFGRGRAASPLPATRVKKSA
ncbi:PAS domain-containing sensor histidine kinase [Methylopila jiangsuensis]|uniref:histidine kinase n=1 Tax=Methylopila jiangsuensis TaxID=586230 RepID=A0A9W6N3P3_9HYPH|nr:PAS domain-containing sensor histidine kinase [Methylopila jiangsuensis]MDR6284036.1 cell cycle sensor histidine kinase DivJ [Methylopila jiangsuensis]GLK76451.1 PAS domain-containing sensor histidine kinase [Methylopila jiangsuensis]